MIELIPIGDINKVILEILRRPLEEVFGQETRIGGSIALPQESWNQHRGQYLASPILAELPSLPYLDDKFLGVVDVDIFAPGLNFVFGETDIAIPGSSTDQSIFFIAA